MTLARRSRYSSENVFEQYVGEDDLAAYVALLSQDTFTVEDAACVIYPVSRAKYQAAATGDEGRMHELEKIIRAAIRAGRLPCDKRTMPLGIKDTDLLNWARRHDLIERPLADKIRDLFRKRMRYSGREIPALEAQVEILGAGLAVLAQRLRCSEKRVTAAGLRDDIEKYQEKFWPNDEDMPLGVQGSERLLSRWLKVLQERVWKQR